MRPGLLEKTGPRSFVRINKVILRDGGCTQRQPAGCHQPQPPRWQEYSDIKDHLLSLLDYPASYQITSIRPATGL
ncbi:MAG: hypothetical protein N2C12_13310 [Planctomycetales bacterium]